MGEPEEILKVETEEQKNIQKEDGRVSRQDKQAIIVMSIITVFFSVRGGEFPGCVTASLVQIVSSFIYGFGLIYLFIGMTKKTFKYNPTRIKIIRWAVTFAAIFAFSEMLHEGYLLFTDQIPEVK